LKRQTKSTKTKNQSVADWGQFGHDTPAQSRLFLALIQRLLLQHRLAPNLVLAAVKVELAILKTHELERAVPEAALIGLARVLEAAGATMVQNPGQGVGAPESQGVQGIDSQVPDGTRGPEELQDRASQAKSDNNGMAE